MLVTHVFKNEVKYISSCPAFLTVHLNGQTIHIAAFWRVYGKHVNKQDEDGL